MGKIDSLPTKCLIFFIKIYRYSIGPILGNHCRFYPSCSSYSIEAITHFGCFRGVYLSVRRLLRCHPWHSGGMDPIPKRDKT